MSDDPRARYTILRIFAQTLHFENVSKLEELPDGESQLQFSWDWQVSDQESFFVILRSRLQPTKARPERIEVAIVGHFRKEGLDPQPAVHDFVTQNAPAILSAYVREAITTLSSHGAIGAFVMQPVNIFNIMKDMQFAGSTGAKDLLADPQLAEAYKIPAALLSLDEAR